MAFSSRDWGKMRITRAAASRARVNANRVVSEKSTAGEFGAERLHPRRPARARTLLQKRHPLELRAQDPCGISAEPSVQHGRVHRAEVHVMLQVVVDTNTGAAVPWSVPPLPFSATRRPNSENATTSTRSALP
jgi:hypothetical protein